MKPSIEISDLQLDELTKKTSVQEEASSASKEKK